MIYAVGPSDTEENENWGFAAMVKHELQSIVSALVGGARYGVKIRLPHALVMTVLFRRDLSGKDKLKNILKLAYQHASSLAAFAAIYKTILSLLKVSHRKLMASPMNPSIREGVWKMMGRKLLTMLGELLHDSASFLKLDSLVLLTN